MPLATVPDWLILTAAIGLIAAVCLFPLWQRDHDRRDQARRDELNALDEALRNATYHLALETAHDPDANIIEEAEHLYHLYHPSTPETGAPIPRQ